MVECWSGQRRTTDVEDYDDCRYANPYSVFSHLILQKFIDLNVNRGTATQLRDFKIGRELEKSLPIPQVQRKRGGYYWLGVEVWGSFRETREVWVEMHKLVYYTAVCGKMRPGEWLIFKRTKEIHHKDGDKSHNGIGNLVALTPEEHQKVGKETGVHKQTERGISRDDPIVAEIKQLRAAGLSYRKIEEQTGLNRETCRLIDVDEYRFRE
jgi:hypothetical protein